MHLTLVSISKRAICALCVLGQEVCKRIALPNVQNDGFPMNAESVLYECTLVYKYTQLTLKCRYLPWAQIRQYDHQVKALLMTFDCQIT